MTVTVRALDEFDDVEAALDTYTWVDAVAFGGVPAAAEAAAKRPLVEPDRWYLAQVDGEACGGLGSFPFELTLPGGAAVPVGGVSDVGVLPTHRRRGVFRSLVGRQLDDLAERGEVAAVLHASEAGIYRRFGYGPATRWRQLRVDTRRAGFLPGWPDPGGRYQMVPRPQAAGVCAAVHDTARRHHAGGLSRSEAWWKVVLGDVPTYIGGGRRNLVMVHRDDSGSPDGYAIYQVRTDWSSGQAAHELQVWEIVAADDSVELGLWRTLFDHDLVEVVTGPISVDNILWEVLADPRQARVLWEQDLLWARILDVPAALSRRTYQLSGRIVLEVTDGTRKGTGGSFELESDGADAHCRRTDAPADLRLDVSDLGASWLGGGSLRRLVRAGRVQEHLAGAAQRADAMFRTDPAPWCWVRF